VTAVRKYGTSRFLTKQQLYEVAQSLRALTGRGRAEFLKAYMQLAICHHTETKNS
jgi:hypothetical protein